MRVQGAAAVVESDRRRLEQIVANLVGNALEHGGRDVAVQTGADDAGAYVEVEDQGGGLTPEQLERTLDRFYKADPSRTGSGSGLGLATRSRTRACSAAISRSGASAAAAAGSPSACPTLAVAQPLQSGDGPVAGGAQDEARNRE